MIRTVIRTGALWLIFGWALPLSHTWVVGNGFLESGWGVLHFACVLGLGLSLAHDIAGGGCGAEGARKADGRREGRARTGRGGESSREGLSSTGARQGAVLSRALAAAGSYGATWMASTAIVKRAPEAIVVALVAFELLLLVGFLGWSGRSSAAASCLETGRAEPDVEATL